MGVVAPGEKKKKNKKEKKNNRHHWKGEDVNYDVNSFLLTTMTYLDDAW